MSRPTLAADIGGTWLRVRIGSGPVQCTPSPSILTAPDVPVPELRQCLVAALAEAAPAGALAAVSVGAAIDHLTGRVHGSAPLWGDAADGFDLAGALRSARPDVDWVLVNDVTAGVVDLAHRYGTGARRVGYLTVSSGIALRTADLRLDQVPVDEWGMQGEIGHLPLTGSVPAALRDLPCECGGRGHLASLSSGPGIARAARAWGRPWLASPPGRLAAALGAGHPDAHGLLDAVVAPVAEAIRTLWCLDPHVDLLGIGGGVVTGLAPFYGAALRRRLSTGSHYADRGYSTGWLDARLRLCDADEVDPLRGAETVAASDRLRAAA